MALFASVLFAIAFCIAVATIVGTLMPARDRILHLLRNGPQATLDPLPPVRLTSRRGVIRQRGVTAEAVAFRAAA